MQVLVAVDIEGISGIANAREYEHFTFGRDWITADTNAAIEGALAGGADRITVTDTHGAHNENIRLDLLHPRARLIRGGKNTPLYFLEGLADTTDVVLLVGWHDKIGGEGVLAHTFVHLQVQRMCINDIEVGEVEIAAGLAGDLGVPVGLVTGDDVTCGKAQAFLGDVETAITKRAIDRYAADCLPLEEARASIRQAACRAVERAREFKPYRFASPYTLEWVCGDHHIATMIARVPGSELLPKNTVRYRTREFRQLLNMLVTWRTILRADQVPY
jgi:D-amino peptidase